MIEAVKDKIVLEKLTRTKSKAGIILPTDSIDPQAYGRVVTFGPDVEGIKTGDILTYHTSACRAVYLKQKFIDIVKYDEIYGKLIDEETIEEMVVFGSVEKEKESIIKLAKAGGGGLVT